MTGKHDVSASAIRHLLIDADGVLQDVPGGWYAAVEPWLGERARDFLHTTWKNERPYLSGGDYLPVLTADLAAFGIHGQTEQIFAAAWQRTEPHPPTLDLLARLQRQGYGLHLGTNQDAGRAAWMQRNLGYQSLFDQQCYSCELGAAKPDPEFFARALALIGAPAHQVLFIDDTAANVEGARSAGLAAEQWTIEDGIPALVDLLKGHGMLPD